MQETSYHLESLILNIQANLDDFSAPFMPLKKKLVFDLFTRNFHNAPRSIYLQTSLPASPASRANDHCDKLKPNQPTIALSVRKSQQFKHTPRSQHLDQDLSRSRDRNRNLFPLLFFVSIT